MRLDPSPPCLGCLEPTARFRPLAPSQHPPTPPLLPSTQHTTTNTTMSSPSMSSEQCYAAEHAVRRPRPRRPFLQPTGTTTSPSSALLTLPTPFPHSPMPPADSTRPTTTTRCRCAFALLAAAVPSLLARPATLGSRSESSAVGRGLSEGGRCSPAVPSSSSSLPALSEQALDTRADPTFSLASPPAAASTVRRERRASRAPPLAPADHCPVARGRLTLTTS